MSTNFLTHFGAKTTAFGLLLGLTVLSLSAGQTPVPASPPPGAPLNPAPPPHGPLPPLEESSMSSLTNMPLKVISPGVFELGKVKLDKSRREVTFPAVLNLKQGPMEYFLVTSYGKTHESVLRTDVRPFYIHIAMLLLGINAASVTNSGPLPQGGIVANPSTADLPGDKIAIEVGWTAEGKQIRKPAGALLYNEETKKALENANWVYNGSRVVQGYFVAQMGGSVVSLVTDTDALANNEAKGHDNDKIWTVNTNSLPPLNEPLEVTFRLLEEKSKP